MTIDFSQFGASGNIDPTVLDEQGDGNYNLPDMKDCVLTIVDVGSLQNDSGWQAANFEVQVSNDGGSGQHNGKSTRYSITLANPSFPQGAEWGIGELKRWAAACGLQQLSSSDQLIGKSFMCNTFQKKNKKDPAKMDQKIGNLRSVGGTAPAQGFGGQPQQQGFASQQPKQGFNPQQQQPQQQGGFNPQQGAVPAFAQPQ